MGRLKDIDLDVVVSFTKLFKGHTKKIKYKEGFRNKDITTNRRTTHVYNKIMYTLFELMIIDVIEGHVVYLDKKRGARLYVDFMAAPASVIEGKNIKKDRKAPLIDLQVTGYKMPFIAYDPGGSTHVCKMNIPMHLYTQLVLAVNTGKKYIGGTKKFWYDR